MTEKSTVISARKTGVSQRVLFAASRTGSARMDVLSIKVPKIISKNIMTDVPCPPFPPLSLPEIRDGRARRGSVALQSGSRDFTLERYTRNRLRAGNIILAPLLARST